MRPPHRGAEVGAQRSPLLWRGLRSVPAGEEKETAGGDESGHRVGTEGHERGSCEQQATQRRTDELVDERLGARDARVGSVQCMRVRACRLRDDSRDGAV